MDTSEYSHVATLCHASSNVCPKVYVNTTAPEERQVMIEYDFGGQVFLSQEQLQILRETEL